MAAGGSKEMEIAIAIAGKVKSSFNSALSQAVKGIGGISKAVGAATVAAAAAVGAMGIAAINAGIEYESAFAGVKKTIDATDEQLAKLDSGIRAMSMQMPTSAAEIAGVAEAAGQLGIQTDNVLGFVKTMTQLGDATNLSADEAATTLARFANVTGMAQTDFDRLGSSIVALGNNYATTESEIADMAQNLAAAGSQVGMSEAQILGFSAALSSVGMEAAAGGTAMSKLMIDMQVATETGGDALKNFANVANMSVDEFKSAFQTDAAGAIATFITGLNDTERLGKSAVGTLTDMGITETRLRDTILRAAGAGDIFTSAINTSTEAWEENIALSNEVSQRYSTMESQIAILKNGLTNLGISFYQDVRNPLVDIVKTANSWISTMSEAFNANGMSGLTSVMGGVLAEALTMAADYAPDIMNVGVDILTSLVDGIMANSGTIVNAAVQAVSVFIQGLFTLIPQVALAGIDLILQFTQSITAQLPQLMNSGIEAVSNFALGLAARLPEITSTAVQLISSLTQGIQANLPNLIPAAMNALVSFSGSLRSNVGLLVDAGLQLIMALAQSFIDNIPVLIETIPTIVTNIAGIINDNAPKLLSVGIQLIIQLALGIIQAIPIIVANIPQIIQAIVSVFTAFNWLALGSRIITFIGNGIKTAITSLPQIFNNFVQTAHNIVSSFGWQSLGRGIIQLLADGISSMITAIPQIFGNIGNFAVQTITSIDWWGVGTTIIQLIGEAISGAGGFILDAIKGIGGGIVDGIKGLFNGADVDVSSSGAAATQSYAAGIAGNASAVSGAASTLTTTAFSNMDLSGAMNAGTEAGTAFSTGLTDSLSSGGFDSSAFSANMTTIGTEGATSLTEGLNAGLTAATIDTASLTVDTSGFTTSMTTAGTEGAAAIGSGMESNSQAVTAAATSLETGINTALDNGWQKAESSAQTAMQSLTQTVTTAAQAAAQAVKSAFENMTITIPKPKIPVINVSTSSVSYGDGGSVSVPNFSVSWNALGGIFDQPTIFNTPAGMQGVGEKGPEAILPLDTLWGKMKEIMNEVIATSGGDSMIDTFIERLKGIGSGGGGGNTPELAGAGGPNITYAPVFNLYGSAGKEEVSEAAALSQEEFNKYMEQYERDKQRRNL